MSLKLLYALPLATLMLAGSAHAYDPIVQTRGWKQVAYDKDQGCEGEVRGNGQIYYIYAVGLGASTQGRYHLTNVDMEPIDWNITADDNGEWARYYIPFHYNLEYAADQPRYSGPCNAASTSPSTGASEATPSSSRTGRRTSQTTTISARACRAAADGRLLRGGWSGRRRGC